MQMCWQVSWLCKNLRDSIKSRLKENWIKKIFIQAKDAQGVGEGK